MGMLGPILPLAHCIKVKNYIYEVIGFHLSFDLWEKILKSSCIVWLSWFNISPLKKKKLKVWALDIIDISSSFCRYIVDKSSKFQQFFPSRAEYFYYVGRYILPIYRIHFLWYMIYQWYSTDISQYFYPWMLLCGTRKGKCSFNLPKRKYIRLNNLFYYLFTGN